MWDELKSDAEITASIERQLDTTTALLSLPRSQVLAISAQKALLSRIRNDNALLSRSGIKRLELLLAAEIIPAKQEIMRAAVQREIGSMVEASRSSVTSQLAATLIELKELSAMSGRNRSVAQAMVARLEVDRKNYHATVQAFRDNSNTIMEQGTALLKQLSDEEIANVLNKDREFIEQAWTTAGMWKNMQSLFQHFTQTSSKILAFSNKIKNMVDMTYTHFHEKFGFAKLAPPALNLEKHTLAMTNLQETAKQFCHDPVNVAKYKHFVVRAFYESLVGEARQVFEFTRMDVESWLKAALNPLNLQIKDYEQVLAERIDNFKKIRDNLTSVQERLKQLEKQQALLQQQSRVLARIKACIAEDPAHPPARAAAAPPRTAQAA